MLAETSAARRTRGRLRFDLQLDMTVSFRLLSNRMATKLAAGRVDETTVADSRLFAEL